MAFDALYTIPPDAPFLATLADALIAGPLFPDWPRQGPFWLADMTIYLPTRRAATALSRTIADRLGDSPALLPDIRPLGGDDPTEEPFLPPYEPLDLAPPVNRLQRRLLLAQLVEKWLARQSEPAFSAPALGGFRGPANAAEILALAESLGTLIDDFAVARIDPAILGQIDDAQLPERWQDHLDFVGFVLEHWPAILAARGEIEGAARTNLLLEKKAASLHAAHGERPVLVAGSTGSMPATADLIAAIARLPRGAVVLPGLDTAMSPETFAHLADPGRNPHGHPQYGMARLLRRLGALPQSVTPLAPATARTTALNAALALAPETAHWPETLAALGPHAIAEATKTVAIAAARTPEEEARAVALAICDALDTGKTVAVVTPDRTLARRIAAELKRFAIDTDDAAGTPLARTRTGRLIRQIVTALTGGFAAVDVMALLHNRHVALGLGRAVVSPAAGWLDFALLRGQRPAQGMDGLKAALAAHRDAKNQYVPLRLDAERATAVATLLDALEAATAPLATLCAQGPFDAAAIAKALTETLSRVTAVPEGETRPLLDGEDVFLNWAEQMARSAGTGPHFDAASLPLALDGLLSGPSVRPRRVEAEDVVILGRLEARLLSADRMILCGLVEGVWPEVADPGPWLSRGLRLAAGLEPPEKLHGLAAHDFLMAAGAPDLLLSYAERAGTSPATPSRLLQRLEAFLGSELTAALHGRGAHWVELARRLDLTGAPPQPATRPAPKPPLGARPRSISITEAETLLRSPYDLYARYGLRLRAVPALGADPDLAERGTIVHDIFGDFFSLHPDALHDETAHALIMDIARARFSSLDMVPDRRDIWIARFARAAEMFLAFERARDEGVVKRHPEIAGTIALPGLDFTLRGRADRIDVLFGGGLEVLDFKTGSLPADPDMVNLFAPQLPLEAWMAAEGAFGDHLKDRPKALTYLKISNKPESLEPKPFKIARDMDVPAIVDAVMANFRAHVDALLLSDTRPMAARVFPNPKQRFKGDYDHLARAGEWTLLDTVNGEDEP